MLKCVRVFKSLHCETFLCLWFFCGHVAIFPAGTGEYSSEQWRLSCVWWARSDCLSSDAGGGLFCLHSVTMETCQPRVHTGGVHCLSVLLQWKMLHRNPVDKILIWSFNCWCKAARKKYFMDVVKWIVQSLHKWLLSFKSHIILSTTDTD